MIFMTESEIRNLFEQWVDAWNSNDTERIRPFYGEDVVLYQAPVKKTLVGVDHIIARGKDLFEMSEDARLTVRKLHVAGDTAIMELNIAGIHTGRFLDYEPTGRKFDIDSCLIFKVKDGKIIKHTTYLDTATIVRALGLLTIPGVRPEAA
ncbi:MAG: hypothetical protein A2074_04650 [Candidatus Aquicultor primus]|uniref:SnoaL-like domain-containing protein n=1 Tax=Candidatus Aquicultor primus TaxID=1797195 RepID=A0A1F2UQ78_9ACTN|nr:MAG: hypothetical protein A2074_04650 [Candidatus Aquicultor primus]